jgi:hypothetical protein
MIDVSDPAAPHELGVYDTPAYALRVVVQRGPAGVTAYVADGDGGLRIIGVNDPAHPVELGSHNPLGHALNTAVTGSLLYVAGGFSGLRIFDVADPEHPREIGRYHAPGDCADVAVIGDTAYVVTHYGDLYILDVSDPTAPAMLGSRGLPDGGHSIAVLDQTAYTVSEGGGLRITGVSDPMAPVEIGSYPVPGVARAVAVAGTVAYVAAGPAGLAAVDVSDPGRPALLSLTDTPGDAWNLTVTGHTVFVADWISGGVRVINVTDPSHPVETAHIALPGQASGVEVGMPVPDGSPRVLYASQGGDGLFVVDLVAPGYPILASYDTPGDLESVTVAGATAYLADHVAGLNVVRLLRDRQQMNITPSGGSLTAADASFSAIFPAGAFTETVTLTCERLAVDENTGPLRGIGQTYRLRARAAVSGRPAALTPGKDYAVVVRYTDAELGPIIEKTLRLRYREEGRWLVEPTGSLHAGANAITAFPQRLGWWAALGEIHRVYLPLALHNAN